MDKRAWGRLASPEAAYRGKPFWSWNGELKEEELLFQIDCMKEMGFGGFFMHSRTGLKTEYLGEEWFRLIRRCAEYGAALGMEAWLYDEDRWPSGTCGGTVTFDRSRRLRFISEYDSDEEALACEDVEGILARYALRFDGDGRLAEALPVGSGEEVPAGYRYAVYAEELMQCGDFYNGAAYLDTMNGSAVEAFLRSTHERYAQECGDMLGKQIKGIFTDEPHRGALFNGFTITNPNRARMAPYTGALLGAYSEKYGEELCIPELYYLRSGCTENAAAAKYIDVLDDLFTHNFAEKYADWCKEHGIVFTGHILHEDNLSFQTGVSGSMMRFYEYMDYPGIDNLTAHNGCYWAAIQCASVARQMGKPFVLSELYGCSGWDMPLSEYKRIGDWHALFGVNLRCPHLSWYTMEGEAKRDYPTSILHQNSWYRDWNILETYFARIGILLTEGERRADILVIHPVENMWKLVRKGWLNGFASEDERVTSLDESFIAQCKELIGAHREFDYGDEELLRKYASVGKDEHGAYLRVGKAVYRHVLLAEGQAVRESTESLLREFAEAGGKVCSRTAELPVQAVLSAPKGIAAAVREWEGDTWLFLLNLSETEPARGDVCLAREYDRPAEEWDMVAFENLGECSLRGMEFAPGQTRIFRLTERAERTKAQELREIPVPEKMPYELLEPNVLPLDFAVCYWNGEALEGGAERDVLLTDRALRGKLGLTVRGGEMVQPWFAEKYDPAANAPLGNIRLVYAFESETECDALIAAEYDALQVNGSPVSRAEGRWVDSCFRLYRTRIRRGKNEICAEFPFTKASNIEAVYVLGHFGVKLPRTIFPLPELLAPQDIGGQGLPYYGGAISFSTGIRGGCVRVKAESLHGATLHVSGGEEEKIIAFPPYECDIALRGELILTLYLTRRNTFGPNHLIPQPAWAYGPESWVSEGENRSDAPVLVGQGFTARVFARKEIQ